MDVTLSYYMKLNPAQAVNKVAEILEYAKNNHSLVTILWHNTYFIEKPEYTKVYENILQYIKKHNGIGISSGQILENYLK